MLQQAKAVVILHQGASFSTHSGMKFVNGVPVEVLGRKKIDELKGNPRFSVTEVDANENTEDVIAKKQQELGETEKAEATKAKVAKTRKLKKKTTLKKKGMFR